MHSDECVIHVCDNMKSKKHHQHLFSNYYTYLVACLRQNMIIPNTTLL